MTSVRDHAAAYLAMRRNLGYKLHKHGRLLMEFIGYLDDHGHRTITIDAATAWATAPASSTPAYWCQRLSAARCFARYLSAFDPACQVPPPGLLRSATSRPAPYLYPPEEIAALIHAAGTLANPLQAATHQALIGLLFTTGMRPGEAVALNAGDVDLDAGLVTICGKYDRIRRVPLHATTVLMLRQYRQRCRQLCPTPATSGFFLSAAGTRLTVSRVDAVFAQLLVHAGISRRRGRSPRVHDIRHSFAVTTFTDWYRDGADVAARMPMLSAVMGHAGPASTFYYLHAAPELLGLAAQRLHDHQQQQQQQQQQQRRESAS